MDIEQNSPKKPNFPLILGLFAVGILILLGLGYMFLHHDAGHVLPDGKPKQSSFGDTVRAEQAA